jgi:hypothetical protein
MSQFFHSFSILADFRGRSKDEVVKWGRFFDGFEPENFPQVREITAHSCTWPTTE